LPALLRPCRPFLSLFSTLPSPSSFSPKAQRPPPAALLSALRRLIDSRWIALRSSVYGDSVFSNFDTPRRTHSVSGESKVMDESEKRKERLRAMRAGDEQDGQSSSAAPMPLLNPLVQLSATPPVADRSPPPSRFDYYTDPMSAYSGNRRSGLAHRLPDSFSSPVHGSSPMAYISSPSSGQGRHFTSPGPVLANNFQVGYSPHQGSYVTPSPVPPYGLWSNPAGTAGPFSGHSSVGMSGSPSVTSSPLGSSRGISASPSFGQGVSLSADPGRGSWSANRGRGRGSPIVNSGTGSSWQPRSYQSPSSGRGSSQRGRFSKESESARESPWTFFNKLMLLDPWDGLEPVVGCILEPKTKSATPDSQQSWLPESIRAKRVKVKETSSVSHSQGSLADYIALAMEEAVNDQNA
ncbi:hypothetical protein Taro_028563, partial [Colocasia esculenta]|nr:hypothetical protein [Colocasia esculenta]